MRSTSIFVSWWLSLATTAFAHTPSEIVHPEDIVAIEKQYFTKLKEHFDEVKKLTVCRSGLGENNFEFSDKKGWSRGSHEDCTYGKFHLYPTETCDKTLNGSYYAQFEKQRPEVRKIVQKILHGSFKNVVPKAINKFMSRPAPKPVDSATDYFKTLLTEASVKNVEEEKIDAGHHATNSWELEFQLKGGKAIGDKTVAKPTSNAIDPCIAGEWDKESIPVLMLDKLEDLDKKSKDLKKKVVLLKSESGRQARDLFFGAAKAARYEAAAFFVPDPGMMGDELGRAQALYVIHGPKIPAGFVKADILSKLKKQDVTVKINCVIKPNLQKRENARNLKAEYGGAKGKKEFILLMSRSDPLTIQDPEKGDPREEVDGVHTQAFGVIAGIQTMALLNKMKLKTKRKVKMVIFAGTEMNRAGIMQWYNKSKDAVQSDLAMAIQASGGCYDYSGLIVSGDKKTTCVVAQIQDLISQEMRRVTGKIYPRKLSRIEAHAGDVIKLREKDIPVVNLNGDYMGKYLQGRMYGTEETTQVADDQFVKMNECWAVMASMTYVLANVDIDIKPKSSGKSDKKDKGDGKDKKGKGDDKSKSKTTKKPKKS